MILFAITIKQPHASLIALGAKKIETRDWSTRHKGPLIITASKTWTEDEQDDYDVPEFTDVFAAAGLSLSMLPTGAALCLVDQLGCFSTEELSADPRLTTQERLFGDYGPDRFGHIYANVRRFDPVIPCRGQLNLWKWTLPLPEGFTS